MYRIEDRPFQYCVVPKEVALVVRDLWGGNNNITINATCSMIHFVLHKYALAPIGFLALVGLTLVLILEPPKPPTQPKDGDLELPDKV